MMITYGYAKGYQYTGDGTLLIRVRIPSIHGPYKQTEYRGQRVRGYVKDEDLPLYYSVLLPHLPTDGEVVAMCSTDDSNNEFIVIGLTGGSYAAGSVNI